MMINRRRSMSSSLRCLVASGFVLSILVFLCLVTNSRLDNSMTLDSVTPVPSESDTKNTDGNIWTLLPGETQRVYLPKFVREVGITVVPDARYTDPTVHAAVFNFGRHQPCPPMTGPTVNLEHDTKFDLPGGGYEYDYYNLLPGSTIDVRFQQIVGGTYFYLLQGASALRDIETGTNVDPSRWEKIAVAKRYIKPTTDATSPRRNTTVHYDVPGPNNDIYTLVYDNDSTVQTSSVDVETDLILTSYDLHGYHLPDCDNMSWRRGSPHGDSCRVLATQQNCVIVEAFSIDSLASLSSSVSDDEKVISVRIETYRNWTVISLLSAIPWSVAVLICVCQFLLHRFDGCCYRRRYWCGCRSCCSGGGGASAESDDADYANSTDHDTTNPNNISTLVEPLLPHTSGEEDINYDRIEQSSNNISRPPPTAPPHYIIAAEGGDVTTIAPIPPSAPFEEEQQQQQQDPAIIVIPPEHVYVTSSEATMPIPPTKSTK